MFNKTLKQKLKKNELTIGSWITIGHSAIPEILAQGGFEWLVIDIEHTSIDLSMVQVLISTIQAKGIAALVRVSKNEEVVIKRVLDSGADGIIVPMICNSKDAKKVIEYAQYPPEGKRGVGLYRAQNYGSGFENYKSWLKNNLVVIAQIEHYRAVNNIEEIITTPGIDGILVGPYDLSASFGLPGQYENKNVKEALQIVEKVCKKNKFSLGYHVIEPKKELLEEKINSGYTFIAFSTDFLFMLDSINRNILNKN